MVKVIIPILLLFIYCVYYLCPSVILPLFPTIADSLHVTRVELHESIGFIIAGIFFSQLTVGMNIETLGYRNVFCFLFIMLCTGSLVALNATNIYIFFLGEFIQGFGFGAAVPIIAGLVNIFEKERADIILSYARTFPIFILFLAPLIGDQFHESWNHVFYVVLSSGLMLFILSFFIPQHAELYQKNKKNKLQLMRQLIKNKPYLSFASTRVLLNIGFFVFLAWAPFLLIVDLHLSHHQFSYLMIFPTVALFLGGVLSHTFTHHHKAAIYIGGILLTISGLSLIVFYFLDVFTTWSILCAGALYFLGMGLAIPPAFLGMFSSIEDQLTDVGVILCAIMINLMAAIVIFILANIRLDEKLLLGIIFTLLGATLITIMLTTAKTHLSQ